MFCDGSRTGYFKTIFKLNIKICVVETIRGIRTCFWNLDELTNEESETTEREAERQRGERFV